MSDAEDQSDVERVLAGDREAFAGIVLRWQRPLCELAWRFVRERGRAEDLAQEAFLQAFRSLAGWRGDAAFSTWLFALATNVYRSRLRRMPLPLEEHELERIAGAESGEPDDSGELVRRAVLALPEKYRDALTLYYFHELDLHAAAASLGVSEGTLKAQLHRGRKLLERTLAARTASKDR